MSITFFLFRKTALLNPVLGIILPGAFNAPLETVFLPLTLIPAALELGSITPPGGCILFFTFDRVGIKIAHDHCFRENPLRLYKNVLVAMTSTDMGKH